LENAVQSLLLVSLDTKCLTRKSTALRPLNNQFKAFTHKKPQGFAPANMQVETCALQSKVATLCKTQ
jgi:hypothetical protein